MLLGVFVPLFATFWLAASQTVPTLPVECSDWPALSAEIVDRFRTALSSASQFSSSSQACLDASDAITRAERCASKNVFGGFQQGQQLQLPVWFEGRLDLRVSCALALPDSTGTGTHDIRTGTDLVGTLMNRPALPSLPEVNRAMQATGEASAVLSLPGLVHVLTLPGSESASMLTQGAFAIPVRGLLVQARPYEIAPFCSDSGGVDSSALVWHLLLPPRLVDEADCEIIEAAKGVAAMRKPSAAVARALLQSLRLSIENGVEPPSGGEAALERMALPRVQCCIASKKERFVDFALADAFVRHEVAKGVATSALVAGVSLGSSMAAALINQSPEAAAAQCVDEYVVFVKDSLEACGLSAATIAQVDAELQGRKGAGSRRQLYIAPGVSTGPHTFIAARFRNAGQPLSDLQVSYEAWRDNMVRAAVWLEISSFGALKVNVVALPEVFVIQPPESTCSTNTLATTGLKMVAQAHPELGLPVDGSGAPLPLGTHFSSTFPGQACKLWWAGLANVAGVFSWIVSEYTGRSVDDSMLLFVHEWGHNLGLWHGATVDPFTGALQEYQEPLDPMASIWGMNASTSDFNAAFKHDLRWIGEDTVKTVSSLYPGDSRGGTFQLRGVDYTADDTFALPPTFSVRLRHFMSGSTQQRYYYSTFRAKSTLLFPTGTSAADDGGAAWSDVPLNFLSAGHSVLNTVLFKGQATALQGLDGPYLLETIKRTEVLADKADDDTLVIRVSPLKPIYGPADGKAAATTASVAMFDPFAPSLVSPGGGTLEPVLFVPEGLGCFELECQPAPVYRPLDVACHSAAPAAGLRIPIAVTKHLNFPTVVKLFDSSLVPVLGSTLYSSGVRATLCLPDSIPQAAIDAGDVRLSLLGFDQDLPPLAELLTTSSLETSGSARYRGVPFFGDPQRCFFVGVLLPAQTAKFLAASISWRSTASSTAMTMAGLEAGSLSFACAPEAPDSPVTPWGKAYWIENAAAFTADQASKIIPSPFFSCPGSSFSISRALPPANAGGDAAAPAAGFYYLGCASGPAFSSSRFAATIAPPSTFVGSGTATDPYTTTVDPAMTCRPGFLNTRQNATIDFQNGLPPRTSLYKFCSPCRENSRKETAGDFGCVSCGSDVSPPGSRRCWPSVNSEALAGQYRFCGRVSFDGLQGTPAEFLAGVYVLSAPNSSFVSGLTPGHGVVVYTRISAPVYAATTTGLPFYLTNAYGTFFCFSSNPTGQDCSYYVPSSRPPQYWKSGVDYFGDAVLTARCLCETQDFNTPAASIVGVIPPEAQPQLYTNCLAKCPPGMGRDKLTGECFLCGAGSVAETAFGDDSEGEDVCTPCPRFISTSPSSSSAACTVLSCGRIAIDWKLLPLVQQPLGTTEASGGLEPLPEWLQGPFDIIGFSSASSSSLPAELQGSEGEVYSAYDLLLHTPAKPGIRAAAYLRFVNWQLFVGDSPSAKAMAPIAWPIEVGASLPWLMEGKSWLVMTEGGKLQVAVPSFSCLAGLNGHFVDTDTGDLKRCPLGFSTVGLGLGSQSCGVCAPGFRTIPPSADGNGEKLCLPCPADSFAPSQDSPFCLPCPSGATTGNLTGRSSCACALGYEQNPVSRLCVDVDECLTANGGCSHRCVNTEGSYTCLCPAGFGLTELNGRQCVRCADSRRVDRLGLCVPCPAFFTRTSDGRNCGCPFGWIVKRDGSCAAPAEITVSAAAIGSESDAPSSSSPIFGQYVACHSSDGAERTAWRRIGPALDGLVDPVFLSYNSDTFVWSIQSGSDLPTTAITTAWGRKVIIPTPRWAYILTADIKRNASWPSIIRYGAQSAPSSVFAATAGAIPVGLQNKWKVYIPWPVVFSEEGGPALIRISVGDITATTVKGLPSCLSPLFISNPQAARVVASSGDRGASTVGDGTGATFSDVVARRLTPGAIAGIALAALVSAAFLALSISECCLKRRWTAAGKR